MESERKSAHAIQPLVAAPQLHCIVTHRTVEQKPSVRYTACHGVSYEWYGGQ